MKYQPLLLAISTLILTGCGGDPPAPTQTSNQPKPTLQSTNNSAPKSVNASGNPVEAVKSNIPAGARYTIICKSFTGPAHAAEAKLNKESLIKKTGRPDFYVVHEEQDSLLLYGYYTEILHTLNPGEAKRVAADRNWLESLASNSGEKLFRGCVAVPMPQLDPVGNPDWDLAKLDAGKPTKDPKRKYWTVVIAAYTPQGLDENRQPINYKQAAVDSVKLARAQGIEAYYYFGDNMAQVCVGSWPRSAVKEQERSEVDSKDAGDSTKQIFVTTESLSDEERKRIEAKGNIKVYAPKVEISDRTLLQTLQQYSEYAVNSEVAIDKDSGNKMPSFLAEIPKLQPSLLTSGATGSQAPQQTAPNLLNPQQGSPGTTGRLRSAQ